MLHFRAVRLMSLTKNLHSYHHKKLEAISSVKIYLKNQKEFINLHVHLLAEERGLYKHF